MSLLLVRPTPPPLWQGFIAAVALIGVETAVVVVLKHFAPTMAFGTVYLLGVLLVGMAWGFGLAAITALVSAVAFDVCRSWPDGFGLTQLQNWVVVAVFFVVALLANSLAGLARASAIEADRRRHEADLAARQQTALRRVATLVARNVPPSEVFSAVVAELATCLDVQNAALFRYEPDGTALLLAAADEPGLQEMPVGERFSLNGQSVAAAVWTNRPRRTNGQPRLRCRDGSGAHTCVGFALRCRSPDRGRQPCVGSGSRGFVAIRRLSTQRGATCERLRRPHHNCDCKCQCACGTESVTSADCRGR